MDITARHGALAPVSVFPVTSSAHGRRATTLAEEVAVALTCDRTTCAVMMATPACLEDFAIGFCLTEGLVASADEVLRLEVVTREQGVEVRMDIVPQRHESLLRRQRRLAGPLGCGLCGVQSLEEAMRAVTALRSDLYLTRTDIEAAMAGLCEAQALHRATHSLHAAGFWSPGKGLVAAREDVGRHNALDKLVGAIVRRGHGPGEGAVILTSRISVELVQKAACVGIPAIMAASAPTALAVRLAQELGILLIGNVRADGFDAFTHAERVQPGD